MANLVDTIQAEGTFATFTRALEMTELAATLREPGPTLFLRRLTPLSRR